MMIIHVSNHYMSRSMSYSHSSFLTHFNEDGCTNLYAWIRDIVPTFVCDVPEVYSADPSGEIYRINDIIVSANVRGIRKAWGLARGIGESSLFYNRMQNEIIIRPGLVHEHGALHGQVTDGLVQTYFNNDFQTYEPLLIDTSECMISHFYGIESYLYAIGYSVISPQLACLITEYQKLINTIIHRVENSYGSITSIDGLDMGDEPLLDSVQSRINKDWDTSRRILAPGGSKLGEVDISLTDTDKMLVPLEDAICAEAQIPRELIFRNKVATQFELDRLATWAKREFRVIVAPALWSLLNQQGFDVAKIVPPSYRDTAYDASVENMQVDSEYKRSATEKNYASTQAIKLGKDAPGTNMGRQL
jgi:hypothetical protein